jgi:hypothetical protein
MEAWYARETDPKAAPARKVDRLRAALLRTYEEAEHARSCRFWQGHDCNCFLDDVAKALGREARV